MVKNAAAGLGRNVDTHATSNDTLVLDDVQKDKKDKIDKAEGTLLPRNFKICENKVCVFVFGSQAEIWSYFCFKEDY